MQYGRLSGEGWRVQTHTTYIYDFPSLQQRAIRSSDSTTTRPRHDWAQPHNNLKYTVMVDLVVKAAVYKNVLHAYMIFVTRHYCITLCTHLSVETQVAGTQNSATTEGIMYITAIVGHKGNSSDTTTTTWPRHTTGHSHTTTSTHNS